MKITLAITIYNKEDWVESILKSWIENAKYPENLEIVIVFDGLKDNSEINVKNYLANKDIPVKYLYADDMHEIFCNNLALTNSSGDYVIFIQDDNWIYDKNWDETLLITIKKLEALQIKPGGIALLAGAVVQSPNFIEDYIKSIYFGIRHNLSAYLNKKFKPIKIDFRFRYKRVETDRSSKGNNFSIHNIPSQPFGIWRIHHVTRPFCVERKLIQNLGGLNKEFMPHMGDDIDLSYNLIRNGYTNIYIPFDLLNISTVADDDKHGNLFNLHSRIISILRRKYPEWKTFSKKYPLKKLLDINFDERNNSIKF